MVHGGTARGGRRVGSAIAVLSLLVAVPAGGARLCRPPVVALFLCGMFWRAATADAASATMLIGSLCGLALFLSNVVFRWTHLHFLYAAPLLTVLDVGILVAVSSQGPRDGSAESTTWQAKFGRARIIACSRSGRTTDFSQPRCSR